jgi:hypothetical protein
LTQRTGGEISVQTILVQTSVGRASLCNVELARFHDHLRNKLAYSCEGCR